MTKSLFAIALAAATLGFAAPQNSTPASGNNSTQATAQKPKKHVKKSHKAAKKGETPSNAAPAKPASK